MPTTEDNHPDSYLVTSRQTPPKLWEATALAQSLGLTANEADNEADDAPAAAFDPNLRLIQVTSPEVYASAHLPGALLVQPGQLVCGVPPATGRLPELAQLEALFSSLGYQPDQHIVVMDDEGGGWAGRLGWTLDVIGHYNWSYLDGGLHAWAAAGLEFSQEPVEVPPTDVSLTIHREPIAEIDDILAGLDDPNEVVWDVRSAEEYAGLRQAAARVGHIPGAINYDWMYLKDPGNHLKLTAGLDTTLQELGIADKRIITHCQTHHRSGLSYLVGRLLGLDIRAYHGSWSEWGNRDDTPIEV